MKKIMAALMIICVAVSCNGMIGYCQGDSADDQMIDQSESAISQNLDSEISGERSQAESQVEQVDSSMDISGN